MLLIAWPRCSAAGDVGRRDDDAVRLAGFGRVGVEALLVEPHAVRLASTAEGSYLVESSVFMLKTLIARVRWNVRIIGAGMIRRAGSAGKCREPYRTTTGMGEGSWG